MTLDFPALKVHQWLPTWNAADFSESEFRRRPPEHFYLMSIPAGTLRRLVGIYRRTAATGRARARDLGVQRAHDAERSEEIREFVQYGFPWSSLSPAKRQSSEFRDLIKPGWLPTAIVVNILTPEDEREGEAVDLADCIRISERSDGISIVSVPDASGSDWQPRRIAPIEVIDGQHRLWSFSDTAQGYELPVVAFHGLDRSWQAYLFYTINIKPKRINTSLAFDLYPLLRTEDWLEKFEGHSIYRETRAQELTEALWSYPDSPWYRRINMLGERGSKTVTQASWIRSLLATIVKSWEGRGVTIGGLFGAPTGGHQLVLPWNRAQQAAFLIHGWAALASEIGKSTADWAEQLRGEDGRNPDLAFVGRATLTNTDIGVRGVLYILNDLSYVNADNLDLHGWVVEVAEEATSESAVAKSLNSLREHAAGRFINRIAHVLSTYDWRTSGAPGLSEDERRSKARFRGGTGYRELREDLLRHLSGGTDDQVAASAREVLARLNY